VSAAAPIYTAGWFGVSDNALTSSALAIYTEGWFLQPLQLRPICPGNPLDEINEERKRTGQLKEYITPGTGSTESPGIMGSSTGEDQVVL